MKEKEKILIVDDAELNREMLGAIFENQFEIIYAVDGEDAIEKIDVLRDTLSIVFLDLMMPKKNGLEVLAHMRYMNLKDKVPVIMITGEGTSESDTKAYEYGADDIIYKPFSANVVTRRAQNLIEQYQYRKQIETALVERTAEVVKTQQQMARMNEFLLEALGTVVEFRSLESGSHIKRVRWFTKIILLYVKSCYPGYKLTDKQIELMSQAAALHDVGKIAIPDEILKAPRKLNPDEFEEMKKHSEYGCEILDRFKLVEDDFFKYCYDICRWHHEKVDGKGYPDGLVGDEIPIYCQAASLADCFDALVSKRVYKDAETCQNAYQMIVNGECGQFSDVILRCFELAKVEIFSAVETIQKFED